MSPTNQNNEISRYGNVQETIPSAQNEHNLFHRLTQSTHLKLILIAACMVVVIFPDIIFMGASLRGVDILDDFALLKAPSSLYPNTPGSATTDGYQDVGAAAWQFEPAIKFIHYCITELESPFWDSYSASGTFGIESLVDIKLAVRTILTALLGGGGGGLSPRLPLFSCPFGVCAHGGARVSSSALHTSCYCCGVCVYSFGIPSLALVQPDV